MPRPTSTSRLVSTSATVVAALGIAAALVALLQSAFGVPDASPVYLLAVVAVAVLSGTGPAVVAAIGAFLVHNLVFTEPRFQLTVSDPGDWLELLLLLVVGIVVGRLAGLQRDRADAAEAREREARAVFGISHAIATAPALPAAAASIVGILVDGAGLDRAWVRIDEAGSSGAVVADSHPGVPLPMAGATAVLRRMPGDTPATWARIHEATGATDGEPAGGRLAYRVRMTDGDRVLGSVWGVRSRRAPAPDRSQTRLLSAAADQLAGALVRRRLEAAATEAEVARRSEALKTALLDAVSHDLRTPLASIRAAAGSLLDPEVTLSAAESRAVGAAIDQEAQRLDRLVSNLLDLGRVQAGALQPVLAVHVMADLVERTVERLLPLLAPRTVQVDVPDDAPAVRADEVWVDQVLTNLLENAARHTPPTTTLRIGAAVDGDLLRLSMDDDGPGVPPASLARLFEAFYRVPGRADGSRRGSGIGLSVVRGLVDAMGGRVEARTNRAGGLGVDVWLPIATRPDRPGDG